VLLPRLDECRLCHRAGEGGLCGPPIRGRRDSSAVIGMLSGRQPHDWRMTSCVGTRVCVSPARLPSIASSSESTVLVPSLNGRMPDGGERRQVRARLENVVKADDGYVVWDARPAVWSTSMAPKADRSLLASRR